VFEALLPPVAITLLAVVTSDVAPPVEELDAPPVPTAIEPPLFEPVLLAELLQPKTASRPTTQTGEAMRLCDRVANRVITHLRTAV
jgi:hypothetical protein